MIFITHKNEYHVKYYSFSPFTFLSNVKKISNVNKPMPKCRRFFFPISQGVTNYWTNFLYEQINHNICHPLMLFKSPYVGSPLPSTGAVGIYEVWGSKHWMHNNSLFNALSNICHPLTRAILVSGLNHQKKYPF